MSLLTPFLKLFKWNTEDTEDLEQPFDIEKAMNENWDKLDTKAQEQENKISDIETNIEDIETKNTEQDELIQKLKNALINETTEQDTSIHISDASNVPAVLTVKVNHYQKTREGYNQLNNTLEDTELNGISVKYNNDGSVTLNGTATVATAIQVSNNSVKLENTDYTYFLKGKTQDFNFYVKQSTGTNHTVLESSSLSERIVKNLGAITIIGAYLYVQKDTVLNNVTVYPMIYKGTEEKEYEQYGAMPSVEYPSEIETVGENNLIQIKNINKNFYKLDISGTSRNGVDYSVENGIVTAKRTAAASSGSYFNLNRVKLPAGTYIISGTDDTYVYANARVEVYIADTIDGSATQVTRLFNTRLSYEYTSDKEFYVSFSVVITEATSINDIFLFKPQVEKNNTKTEFIKHEEKEYNLPIQQEMLKGDYFDLERGKEVHHFHKYVSTSADNWILTTDSPNRFRLDTNITSQNNALNNTNQCCSHSNICYAWASPDKSFQARKGSIYFKTTDFSTSEQFNQFVREQEEAGTPLTFWYECEEYELDLTEEQKQVLNQLNTLDLFKGINNIYTEQNLALLQLDYTVDTKMYIDNKIASQNQQILEIAGGN